MARKARIWFPGASYHIMCRGNHRHDIYRDDEDRQVYLTILRETKRVHGFYLHSYCLMSNHVHLQIETVDIDISTIMKRISLLYTQFFNNKYNFVGHLFQDRFKSELIESDQYHLEISRYIHLNPVRANMTELSIDYEWSSFRDYMGIRVNSIVNKEKTLGYFSEPRAERYRMFVEGGK
ncbi:transposase [Desulfosporosinus youngiae]|uniref:Transposase n=1 Tax=Desulfosporosinus youngiae DSM 17734 TaxID=768710 RepID=H5XZE4_9FIRM|nr:transposase [Desulfosporosinus youngiae]EHQ91850.1 transposase [Desulfosporosinus youngiae DSM 17734]